MDKLEKKISEQEPASLSVIKSIADLLPLIGIGTEFFGWYRGHAEETWELTASIFRGQRRIPEGVMYNRFCNRAFALDKNFPYHIEGTEDMKKRADVMFIMRHHGLPTRILDWSESPLVGLYFAVTDAQNPDPPNGCLWQLYPKELNRRQIGEAIICYQAHDEVKKMVDLGFSENPPIKDGKHIAVYPRQIHQRQTVQQAAYTIQDGSNSMSTLPKADRFLKKITIPANAKIHILNELRQLGINDSILFPDLDGLASYLSRSP